MNVTQSFGEGPSDRQSWGKFKSPHSLQNPLQINSINVLHGYVKATVVVTGAITLHDILMP
jgi:hypothetical protein